MKENKCICEGCKYIKPYAKATVEGVGCGYVCTANEKTFVDISDFIGLNISSCIDFEEDENFMLQMALEMKDMQKVALQYNALKDKGDE